MTIALALAVALTWAAPSGAAHPPADAVHAQLERSVPSSGDTLAVAPPELVLTFSGPVEVSGAMLRLLGPTGRNWSLDAPRRADDPRTLTTPLPPLEPGGYRLEWRVVSADGHAISGEFTFYVAVAAGDEVAPPPPPSGSGDASRATGVATMHDVAGASPLLVATRAGADLALLSLAGLLLFVAWGTATTGLTASVARRLSVVAPLLATAYAWLWAGEVLGGAPGVEARMAGLGSVTTGRALGAEVILAWLVAWALLLVRRPGIAAAFALMAVAVGGLGGHPASYTPLVSVPSSVVHLLAASAWVGGLLFLITEHRAPGFAASARRVSAVAFVSVALVAATGLVQTWLFLGSISALTSSAFGWLVLAKVAGFGGLVAFGAHHRLRLLPAVGSDDGATRLTRSVRREFALAMAVVVLAAILSHTPPSP